MSAAEARMARIRRRLAETTERDKPARMMLVLAHEALRHQEAARTARPSGPEPVSTPALPCDYRMLTERIKQIIARTVPHGARVLVVSRGDEALTSLPDRHAAHFPQGPNGLYAGHHPADS